MLLAALCALFLASCSSLDDGSYTEPITMYEKVGGTWNLSQIKQVDELAVVNKSGMTELDLTDQFENFSLSLNEEMVTNHPPSRPLVLQPYCQQKDIGSWTALSKIGMALL